jgi:ribosomal protein S18 acetylase RimI-like enzyme
MTSTGGQRVLVMRIDLDPRAPAEPSWPAGISVRTFTPGDAEALHSLLVHAYLRGGGSVGDFATWLPEMTGDEEYDPGLWFLASADDVLVGAVLCWTSGFVKDLVVDEAWRRRGLGETLLRCAFTAFAARGITTIKLKVQAENLGAIRLYERVGMRVVEAIEQA